MLVHSRIEWRTWYITIEGRSVYAGPRPEFVPIPQDRITSTMRDASRMARASRLAMQRNGAIKSRNEITDYPIRLSDWGEFRVITYTV